MTRRTTDTTLMLFLATALITLSHLDAFVPDPRIATGGAIGNSLFFFLSGFGLTLSLNADRRERGSTLMGYLRKRFLRLYPAALIVACAMLVAGRIQLQGWSDVFTVFLWPTPFWFISAVVVFYVPVYFIARLPASRIAAVLALLTIPYAFFYSQLDLSQFVVEGPDRFKWINYFGITLLGSLVARTGLTPRLSLAAVAGLGLSLLLFLVTKLTVFRFGLGEWQFLMQLWLYPIVYFSYQVFASEALLSRLRPLRIYPAIALLAGLTLEIYLTQTAWIHWLEEQTLPYGHAVQLAIALLPLLVFSLITQWLSSRMSAGVSRLTQPAPA